MTTLYERSDASVRALKRLEAARTGCEALERARAHVALSGFNLSRTFVLSQSL